MKAVWKGAVLAESDQTELVEGNHYFPAESINRQYFIESESHSYCPWKGEASYYDIKVGEELNKDAAWYYPKCKPLAQKIESYVAFWNGVEVLES